MFSFDDVIEAAKKPYLWYRGKHNQMMNKLLVWGIVIYVLVLILYFLSYLLIAIPVVGIFFFVMSLILYYVFLIGITAYLLGYFFEITKSVYKKSEVVPDFQKSFMSNGWKLLLIRIFYQIPTILMVILTIFLVATVGTVFDEDSGFLLGMFGSFLMYFVILLLSVAVSLLIIPTADYFFLKNGKLSEALDVIRVINFSLKNFKSYLMVFLGTLLISMALYFALVLSIFTIFICVGIVIVPIVAMVFYFYPMFYKSIVYGRLYQDFDDMSLD